LKNVIHCMATTERRNLLFVIDVGKTHCYSHPLLLPSSPLLLLP
jgi:hypothetical protein